MLLKYDLALEKKTLLQSKNVEKICAVALGIGRYKIWGFICCPFLPFPVFFFPLLLLFFCPSFLLRNFILSLRWERKRYLISSSSLYFLPSLSFRGKPLTCDKGKGNLEGNIKGHHFHLLPPTEAKKKPDGTFGKI